MIRDSVVDKSLISPRLMTVLRALVLLTSNHAQQIPKLREVKSDLLSSFEWQSLMKYYIPDSEESEAAV